MSQLNGDAIEKIQELTLAAVHTQELKTTLCPTVMLPSGYGIESLERFNLHRFRFRGALETTSIADFVRYSVGYAVTDTPARCFIDAESMSARAVFNIGSLDEPGHADNVASIRLKKNSTFPCVARNQWRSPEPETNCRMARRLERFLARFRC